MQVKRSGFVFSLYRRNLLHLWLVALGLLAIFLTMAIYSRVYLMNYLFYRRPPDTASLAQTVEENQLDIETVLGDIQQNGGEMALDRQKTSMFFRANVYSEGNRYRFSIPIDREKLTDTGVYYDDAGTAYFNITNRERLKEQIPRENYATMHLWFYEYEGMELLLVMDYEAELELGESLRVTFAPLSIYSLYMVKDLGAAGYEGTICNYFIDGRSTPVDFEDDDFKDLVMVFPFMLLTLIPSILFTICPVLHPTYRQLDKFARTPQKAAEMVDQDYAEFGIVYAEKKEVFLNEWLIKRSPFKTGIERNYKKQKN